MKVTAMVVGTMLVLALTSTAQAVNMFAGPLYPTGADHCECEIVNITAANKTVHIVVLDGAGAQLASLGPFTLRAGYSASVASGASGRQYCKFIGAAPAYFLGTLACFHPSPNDSDFVAVPAR
jgi:hypothetical protein